MKPMSMPFSWTTLIFGAASIPLAFARQLCVPALIVGLLAIAFHLWGRSVRKGVERTPASVRRSKNGFKLAVVGSVLSALMWGLWATNILLR